MRGEHAVGRVIARPFTASRATSPAPAGRRDFALEPPGRSYLVELQDAGVPVHAVGKIRDLFAGVGIDRKHTGDDERGGARGDDRAAARPRRAASMFTNLVETDQVYGHRHDVAGFARRAASASTPRSAGGSTRSWAPTTC